MTKSSPSSLYHRHRFYDFLINKGKLRPGERVLINGASGCVGSACVQLAKHFGAEVTGVCSSSNADLVRDIGADRVIDYNAGDFVEEGPRYDMVVDTVSAALWSRARHALVPNGRMLLIAGNTSDMIFGGLKARLRGKSLIGGIASEADDILRKVVDLAAAGYFNPVIDRSFDFSQMKAAHTHVDTGHKKGNLVVIVNPNSKSKRSADEACELAKMPMSDSLRFWMLHSRSCSVSF